MEKIACNQQEKIIVESQLPLSCPLPNERLWDAHPKVYLEIETNGEVVCPYCETKYVLKV